MSKTLTEDDFRHAADLLGCKVAAIKAVAAVEAPKGGFNPNDTPVTLFEAHWFHRFTDGRFDASHPNLSGAWWDRSKYGKGWLAERRRLAAAIKLDRAAALQSTSWGKFQVMGFNFELAGYEELEVFIADMHETEREHLMAFSAFVKNKVHKGRPLADYLRRHPPNFAAFAEGYNGAAYAENEYDTRMAAAFAGFDGHA